jgi:signal transduction histidine kinase
VSSVAFPSAEASPRRSIALRLAAALGTVVAVLGVVSAACLWALVDIHDRLHQVKQEEEAARRIVSLTSAIRDQYAHIAHTIIIDNDTHAEFFRQASARVLELAQHAEGTAGMLAASAQVDRILASSREIERLFDQQILPAIRKGDRATAVAAHDRVLSLAFQSQSDADTLVAKAEASMEDLNKHVRATQHGAILMTIVAHVLAVATAIFVGLYLFRSIARPVAALASAATRIGEGDLDARVTIERDDELGRLGQRFNEMARATKEHQAEAVRTERLAGLGRMAAGIAHELNNPVGVIMGYAKLLLRRDGTPEREMLVAIEEEAERCQQVIAGLLELTRGSVLQVSPVALRALVDDVVARFRVAGAPAGVKVDVDGEAQVLADEPRLRHVLTNLVGNALEAAGAEGRVSIVIRGAEGGGAAMTVSDSGAGVREEDRSQIFEPFFTRKANGTGLGLSIARAIARAHGGDVDLVATAGVGATFRLTLPAGNAEARS